jgi:hypothetical protein
MSTTPPEDDPRPSGVDEGSDLLDNDNDDDDNSVDGDDDLIGDVCRRAGTDRITAAVWAIAARDCALERGDAAMASLFAGEARDAIAAVLATGVSAAELAAELDYPGGHTEMDGPQIDRDLTNLTNLHGTDRPGSEPTGASRPTGIDHTGRCGTSPAAGLVAAAGVAADGDDLDAARRDQLTRWHHDDHTTADHTAQHDPTQHDGLEADTAGDGGEDPWAW